MAALSGKDGSCTIASTGTLHFNSWSIDYNQEAVETSTFGASGRTYVSGVTGFTLTAEGTLDAALAPAIVGTSVTFSLNVETTKDYTGSAILTGLSPNVNLTGTATATITATGTGPLTIT